MFVALLIALFASSSGSKPEFEIPFQNVTMERGFKQVLNCKAKGEQPITYKWYNQNEDEITTKDSNQPVYVYSSKTHFDSDLLFKRPSSDHEGSYTCTASNAYGLASKVFFLNVSPPSGLRPEFDTPFHNVTLEPGKFQYLRCKAEGEKPMTYKWYNQDGVEITKDRQKPFYVVESELHSDLDFKRLSREHEGLYTCMASNVNGQASKVFILGVPPPSGLKPEFDSPTVKMTLESGKFQYLRCKAEGEKPITYKWYNQVGDEITEDRQNPFYVAKSELHSDLDFKKLDTEHGGPYTCTASNVNGNATRVFFLRVLPPSDGNDTDIDQGKWTSGFRDAKVLKYTSRSVMFNITTSGPFKYIEAKYWEGKRTNTSTIRLHPVAGNNTYKIGNLHPHGLYGFQFRVVPPENGKWSRELIVTLLPEAPEIILESSCNQSVRLQWFAKTDDFLKGTIDRHQIKYFLMEINNGNNWTSRNCSVTIEVPTCVGSSYTIWGLERTLTYQIEVRAHTEGGYGEPWRQKVYLP